MKANWNINLFDSGYPTVQIIKEDLFGHKHEGDIYFIANQSAEDINNWLRLNRRESYIKGKKHMDTYVFAFSKESELYEFLEVINNNGFKINNLFELMDFSDTLGSVYGDVGFIKKVSDDVESKSSLKQYCFEGTEFCYEKHQAKIPLFEDKRSNIFDYATKELSQDAMIAFLISLCSSEFPTEVEIGRTFVDGLLVDTILSNKNIDTVGLPILQSCNVDVLTEVTVDGEMYLIVIEDKTNTNERDGQIAGYMNSLESKYDIPKNRMIPIYFKTSIEYNIYNKDNTIKIMDIYDVEALMEKVNHLSVRSESHYLINSYYLHLQKKVKKYQWYLNEPDYVGRFGHYYISQLISYIYDLQKKYRNFNADITYNNGPSGVVLFKGIEKDFLRDEKLESMGDYEIYQQLQFTAICPDELSRIKDVHMEYRFSKKNGEKISSEERWRLIEVLKDHMEKNYKISGSSGGRTARLFSKSIHVQGLSDDEAISATTMVQNMLEEFIKE